MHMYIPLMNRLSPIGIASIIAGKLMEVDDIGVLFADLGFYMLTVLLGLFIHGVFTLPLIYVVITRRNPLKLVKGVLQALLVAFGISSRCVYMCMFCFCIGIVWNTCCVNSKIV